jgi:hypothetical protein
MSDQSQTPTDVQPADTGPAADQAPVDPAAVEPAPDPAAVDVSGLESRVAALESRVDRLEQAAPVAPAVPVATPPVYPNLAEGDHGLTVQRLAALLEDAGYPNAVEAGTAEPILTTELMDMVVRFQQSHDYTSPLGRGVDTTTWQLLTGTAETEPETESAQ